MKSLSSNAFDGAGTLNALMRVEDVADLIRAGVPLALAGRPQALARLPHGNWIGGSSPYFMTPGGGRVIDDSLVFATDLSAIGDVHVASYGAHELAEISNRSADNGFALTIIPAGSDCHARFAREAPTYPLAFLRPTVGWIAGTDLSEAGAMACVFDGRDGSCHGDRAVVAHVELPEDKLVHIEIVNLFRPDDLPPIRFEEVSFAPDWCEFRGERRHFAQIVGELDRAAGKVPLVGDFAGAHCNASLREVDLAANRVELYAPVFPGVDYRFAQPVEDYADAFRSALASRDLGGMAWSCNCILNFLHGEMEGRAIGDIAGPVTFGEIAYQLLNQTMVILRVV